MKKAICIMLLLGLVLCGCGCNGDTTAMATNKDYITGVWFSYLELDNMLKSDFKAEFSNAIKNCKTLGITDVFVHIRPFCDALYKSQYFPIRETAVGQDFDVLDFMIKCSRENQMRFHAWINPYRVSRNADINALPQDSPAYRWLHDDDTANDQNVLYCDGIYLNPASSQVRELVINGIRELLGNYKIDGIHFDDYFYPTADAEFDREPYQKYCEQAKNALSLADWRRANVNSLISGAYTAVKFYSKDILFSISPAASIQNNYETLFADVKTWLENDCVDIIIPQLYFGFDYPAVEYQFNNLIEEWKKLAKVGNADLAIGLAAYKIGTDAQPDCNEWNDNPTLLKRQAEICQNDTDISGHIFYSYSALFSDAPQNKAALQELKSGI